MPKTLECFHCGSLYIRENSEKDGVTPELSNMYCTKECKDCDAEALTQDRVRDLEPANEQFESKQSAGGFILKLPIANSK